MDTLNRQVDKTPLRYAIEIAVSLGLIILILAWGLMIISPFISLIIWGGVIAIASYTPFQKLCSVLGGNQKLAIALIALLGVSIVIVPTLMFADSLVKSATDLGQSVAAGTLQIPPPAASVQEWPLVGSKIHQIWTDAAANFTAFLQDNADQLKTVGKTILSKVAGAGLGIIELVFSILIAAVFLSNAEAASQTMQRFFRRLVGDQGEAMLDLSVATIRSVAVGVLGIALIQALLAGIGMIVVGVPAAGLWALFVLVVAIAQLPPWIILGPVIVYVFSVESSTTATMFMVWSLMVSFLDMFLKPIMLGRGVEAPMLVILLGAIGGMIMSGIIGLFVGAVVLAMAFKLVQAWLVMGDIDLSAEDSPGTQTPPAQE
ncbi:MAG: AI-2E family transporter [Gammaproteobacteria bacterium]|nr:AI-2E family transporter [Gammaproteobacteria bacterium]MBQ0839687.1 AI-2E family transporter [Gammaproteobacteria bacterium]